MGPSGEPFGSPKRICLTKKTRRDDSTKGVPPRSAQVPLRFREGSPSYVLSQVLWGRKFRGRFHQDSRRLRNFRDVSVLLGQVSFISERILRRVPPITYFFAFAYQFLHFFFAFFPYSVTFGVFSHSKGLGAK